MRILLAIPFIFLQQSIHAQDCSSLTIENCPSLYKERCQNDTDFGRANSLACIEALTATKEDQEICKEIDLNACQPVSCDETGDVLDKFFCERGKSSCTKNAPGLAEEFDTVLNELDSRLLNYKSVIELNTREVSDQEALCKFTRDDLTNFAKQASENVDFLGGYEREIDEKLACSNTLADFMQSERPNEISSELWENLKSMISDGLEGVKERQGIIQSQVEKLAAAPQKLQALMLTHRIGCKQ